MFTYTVVPSGILHPWTSTVASTLFRVQADGNRRVQRAGPLHDGLEVREMADVGRSHVCGLRPCLVSVVKIVGCNIECFIEC
jgi:hypothetical protein